MNLMIENISSVTFILSSFAFNTFSLALIEIFENTNVNVIVSTITAIPLKKEIPMNVYISHNPIKTCNGVNINAVN